MGSRGLTGWVQAKDPGLSALHHALRVTLAACLGFYVCRYIVDDRQMAVFAVFGVIAIGALSQITGTPQQRTRGYLASLAAGFVLVTLGTLLAGNTWAAVAGMVVVGASPTAPRPSPRRDRPPAGRAPAACCRR